METSISLKEEFITYISREQGLCHAMQGHLGKHQFWPESRKEPGEGVDHSLFGVSAGKAWQGRVNSLGLASLNNSAGLWGLAAVPSCLISGPGLI